MKISIYITLSLFVFIACNTDDKSSSPLGDYVTGEVDVIPILVSPDSPIDLDRLNSHLAPYNLKAPDSFINPHDKTQVIQNIDKLKLALKNAVDEDKILIFTLNAMLGVEYRELGGHGVEDAFFEAERYLLRAIKIAETLPELKTDALRVKSNLALIYMYSGKEEDAFDIYTELIENHQHVNIGNYPEWFSVQQVLDLIGSTRRHTQGKDDHPLMKKLAHYLEGIVESYKNEVGVIAGIELYDYYNRTGDFEKAIDLKRTAIEERIEHIGHVDIVNRWRMIETRAEHIHKH